AKRVCDACKNYVINYLKSIGKVQVESYAESDFLMVFCPVVSKVGTDIEAALMLTDGKPAVLVVMHHTFDPHHLVAESRRQVNDARVWLTVDCLFYQKNLLPCPLNDIMQKQVADFLGSSSGSLVRRLLLTRRPHNVVAEMRDLWWQELFVLWGCCWWCL
uniref:Uncharacterized protein n=1 Tax=Gasterosteus aculeatus aculeatus TaxID=481459 RepID=G3PEN0_GASAC